ncbi:MAG: transglycosylase SLT domain-containing protein [Acidobacteriota bacterium]|nr:transglycosylase SLT domain-containing protein [Acidobacteriota bacterium]
MRVLCVMIYTLLSIIAAGEAGGGHVRAQGRESASLREMQMRARRAEPLIREAARRYGVDPRVLWSIAYLETRFQVGLVSPKGARGMMQFMPATASRYGLMNPHDAAQAVDAAAHYVRDLSRRFNNRFELVLAGYNAGEGAVEAYLYGHSLRLPDGRVINPNRIRTGGIPPYTETRNYVARGLEIARALTTANLFAPADSTVRNTLLSMPSEPGGMRRETVAPPETLIAQTAPAFITPASSYALNRAENAATEESNNQPSPATNAVAPIVTARSFRASAAPQSDESSRREVSASNPSRVSTDAPGRATSQPRSTYIRAMARQRP